MNLTWNLLAQCVQLYLKFGVVQSPGERLAQRIIRQKMGENFLIWAEEYYSPGDNSRLNERILRSEIFDSFKLQNPQEVKYTTPRKFRDKIIAFCEWKGYIFNPQRYDSVTGKPMFFDKEGNPDISDKSGGHEYFTVGDKTFWKNSGDVNQNLFVEKTEENLPY
ncbi:hypothetical protein FACS1894145_5800 [Bacteroidia bacterium]|nr:hypothetical protein FACS1894145_5800 [Bacteroidia bacterium]